MVVLNKSSLEKNKFGVVAASHWLQAVVRMWLLSETGRDHRPFSWRQEIKFLVKKNDLLCQDNSYLLALYAGCMERRAPL